MSDKPKRRAVDRWKSSPTEGNETVWEGAQRRSTRDYGTADESAEFYRRLFVESPVAMVITNPDFEISDINEAGQRLLHFSLRQMRGRQFQLSVADNDRDAWSEICLELRDARSAFSRPLLLNVGEGLVSEVIVTAAMIRGASGEPELAVLVFLERGENFSSDIL